MLEKKQEEIAKLYALRAGISVLSEITDNVRQVQKRVKDVKNEISYLEKQLEEEGHKPSQEESDYSYSIKDKERIIKDLKEKEDRKIEELSDTIRKYKSTRRPIHLFVISLLITVAYIWWALSLKIGHFLQFELICTLCLITIILFCWMLNAYIYSRSDIRKVEEELERFIEKSQQEIGKLQKELSDLRANKDSTMGTVRYNSQKNIATLNEKIEEAKDEHSKVSEELKEIMVQFSYAYKATQEQFSDLLDERDWGNVDLIIFNYETGRALDMRDALMQVDNERRNERLVEAINDANRAISNSIERGFGQLQDAMNTQCKRLDRRIQGFSSQVSQISDNAAKQTQAINRRLGELVEISTAQQALLNKMSTSSDEMAEDIAYIQDISKRTYYNF